MINKEKYFEILNTLKEQIINNTTATKARKKEHRREQQWYSLHDIDSWGVYTNPILKKKWSIENFFLNIPKSMGKEKTTVFHIIYNRIRKRPAHTGSFESDERFIQNSSYYGQLFKSILDNHDIICKPNNPYLEMWDAKK